MDRLLTNFTIIVYTLPDFDIPHSTKYACRFSRDGSQRKRHLFKHVESVSEKIALYGRGCP